MAKGVVGVGQHHFIRSYLPALIAVLLSSALALIGAGVVMERNLERLARGMAQRGSPGHQIALELDLSVGQFALDAVLSAHSGDERLVTEATDRLDSAASAYDGWIRAAQIEGVTPVTPAIKRFEERIAVATDGSGTLNTSRPGINTGEVESAVGDVHELLRENRRATADDAARMLRGIADWQDRRRYVELAVMALVACGCIALMIAARRREERVCHDEKNAMRSLEQTNADLEAFAGRVAHDLRNPLVPILSGSQVIERAAGEDGAVRRAAERIERSARRISAMIDMLLDFSRMSTAPQPVETEVRPIIDDVIDGFRDRARAHDIEIEVMCEKELRALAEPIVVASPLQNLIENAFKYGRRPGLEPVVEVRAFWRAGMVIIEVEDRGPGITPAEAESLFHAFSRGRPDGEGVGLGLATARRLVEARGGSIGLRVGRFGGALFQIRLPSPRTPGAESMPSAASGAIQA
jgi:signal transduction histidine kinase